MTITVVGAGGIGGSTAAELRRAGADVVLVDRNHDHVAAVRENGLLVAGVRGVYRVDFDTALTPDEWTGPADLVLLAVKSQDTGAAVHSLRAHLHAGSVVLSLQNGWNARRIAEVIGAERTVAAMVHVVGNHDGPGRITRHTDGVVYIGELDGTASPRTDELATLLRPAFPTESVGNIWGYIWSKQVYGATMPVNALVDLPARTVYAHDWVRGILLAVIAEAFEAATAEGIRLEPYERFDPADFARDDGDCAPKLANLPRGSAKGNSGVWHDIKVRRRRTEVDYLSGELVRIGRRHGLPMTLNGRVVDMIGEIETGAREMSWDNLHALVGPAYQYLSGNPGLAGCASHLRRVLTRRTVPSEGRCR